MGCCGDAVRGVAEATLFAVGGVVREAARFAVDEVREPARFGAVIAALLFFFFVFAMLLLL